MPIFTARLENQRRRNSQRSQAHRRRLRVPRRRPVHIALDTRRNRLFVGDETGDLTVLYLGQPDVVHNQFRRTLQGPAESMNCSSDLKTLVVLDRSALYAWDISNHLETPRWCQVDASIRCFAISPDSASVICGRNRGSKSDLVEINIPTGVTRVLCPEVGRQLKRIIISPDGKYLACIQDDYAIVLLQRSSPSDAWQPCSIPSLQSGGTNIATFTPQSSLLITSNHSGNQLTAWA